jgi:hypothetical protein
LLPENKAEQLTRMLNFQYTDDVLQADRIFHTTRLVTDSNGKNSEKNRNVLVVKF